WCMPGVVYFSLLLLMLQSFPDTDVTACAPLSLHDALPIFLGGLAAVDAADRHPVAGVVEINARGMPPRLGVECPGKHRIAGRLADRKSTRLNSSHVKMSYAAYCFKLKTPAVL